MIDYRKNPELYRVGRGEQGVLTFEPYKSEILPFWRFSTPAQAKASANKIYSLFEAYMHKGDFVGADMARKFLQMGYTRSMRYYYHAGGKKYDGPVPANKKGQSGAHGRATLPDSTHPDQTKRESALIFKEKWDQVRANKEYQLLKKDWQQKHG